MSDSEVLNHLFARTMLHFVIPCGMSSYVKRKTVVPYVKEKGITVVFLNAKIIICCCFTASPNPKLGLRMTTLHEELGQPMSPVQDEGDEDDDDVDNEDREESPLSTGTVRERPVLSASRTLDSLSDLHPPKMNTPSTSSRWETFLAELLNIWLGKKTLTILTMPLHFFFFTLIYLYFIIVLRFRLLKFRDRNIFLNVRK